MARVLIPTTPISTSGVVQPAAVSGSQANDHIFEWSKYTILEAKNTHGSNSQNLTIVTAQLVDGHAVDDDVIAVAAGVTRYFSDWDRELYCQTDGDVYVNVAEDTWQFRAYDNHL